MMTLSEACKVAGISFQTAQTFESGSPSSSGFPFYAEFTMGAADSGGLPLDVIPQEDWKEETKLAVADFTIFRPRYSGMVCSPWQRDAAGLMEEKRVSPERSYVVFNMPPESGKTTFIRDFAARATAMERSIKGLIGSFANDMAWNMMTDLGNMLTRRTPWQAPDRAKRAGGVDALSTMWMDFGRFEEENGGRWNRQELLVMQDDGQNSAGKEATWTSYGRESGKNLGSRYDFIVWDDLVTGKSIGTMEALAKLIKWWDEEGETRLNEGGLLVLLGQRIASIDLYRHALDKMGFDDDMDDDDYMDAVPTGKKYYHISYMAHQDEDCKGPEYHRKNSVPWNPEGTGGCLLEPRRVGWKHIMQIKANRPNHYATQYQQKEGDPASVLIPELWLKGGKDPETGEELFGCWDDGRDFWQVPSGLSRPIGVITVDPSPTKYWGVQAWVYVPQPDAVKRTDGTMGGLRYLVAMSNKPMDAPGFLEYHQYTQKYTGLLTDWHEEFNRMGVPLKWVIFEEAAAQRWALQYEIIRNWYRNHNVHLVGHKTHGWNKPDPTIGITMLKSPYRAGLVRLPRLAYMQLRKEFIFQLTNYNDEYRGATDQLMSNWFLEHNLQNIVKSPLEQEPPRTPGSELIVVGRGTNMRSVMAR